MPVDCLYPIRYADCKQMQWSTGMIVRQRVVTYDFLIELFESRLIEDLQIEVVFNKPCVVFYYGFSGTVICENKVFISVEKYTTFSIQKYTILLLFTTTNQLLGVPPGAGLLGALIFVLCLISRSFVWSLSGGMILHSY